jgi:hypothetical protein
MGNDERSVERRLILRVSLALGIIVVSLTILVWLQASTAKLAPAQQSMVLMRWTPRSGLT